LPIGGALRGEEVFHCWVIEVKMVQEDIHKGYRMYELLLDGGR
jgi:hypothetical protein